MKPITLRFDEETIEQLDVEAEEFGFANRSDYLRHIIEMREVPGEDIETARGQLATIDEKLDYILGFIDMQRLTKEQNSELMHDRLGEHLRDDGVRADFEERSEKRLERAREFIEKEREHDGEYPWNKNSPGE